MFLFSFLLVLCPEGSYYNTSSRLCLPCKKATYQDELGQLQCKHCPLTKTTHTSGSSDYGDCEGNAIFIFFFSYSTINYITSDNLNWCIIYDFLVHLHHWVSSLLRWYLLHWLAATMPMTMTKDLQPQTTDHRQTHGTVRKRAK